MVGSAKTQVASVGLQNAPSGEGIKYGETRLLEDKWCIRQHREFYSGSPETKGSFRIEKSDFLHLTVWA